MLFLSSGPNLLDPSKVKEVANSSVAEVLAFFLSLSLIALVWGARHYLANFERMIVALVDAKNVMHQHVEILKEIPEKLQALRNELKNELIMQSKLAESQRLKPPRSTDLKKPGS